MPVMTDVTTVAANATTANILSGKLHEFISGMAAARIRVFMTSSAGGLNASVLVGGESFMQDQEVSGAARFPLDPDDFLVEAGGFAGDRIVISLRNTTGGNLTARTRIQIDPVS